MNKHEKYNLKVKEELEKKNGMKISDHSFGWDQLANTFVCTSCGEFVRSTNIVFYKFNVLSVKCYECQEREGY